MADNTEIRILVLDDELLMLKMHAQMLAHLGFTDVSTAQSGHDALARMDEENRAPDLILLDLGMPAMDGIEFIRRLVGRNFEGRLILVSGEDERVLRTVEKLAEAHHVRVLGHLSKPIQEEKLAVLLRRWRPASGTFEIAWKPSRRPRSASPCGSTSASTSCATSFSMPTAQFSNSRSTTIWSRLAAAR